MSEKHFWETVFSKGLARLAIGTPSRIVHCTPGEVSTADEGTMCLVKTGNEVFVIDVQKVDSVMATYENAHGAKGAVKKMGGDAR